VTSKEFIPVKGHPDLVRDSESKAVLNTKPTPPGNAAKKRKQRDDTIDNLKSDVDVLKSDMSEIKSLLKTLLEQR
tara:strand:- start:3443 stop:3667 length:225 start_codon:yes stop_codon:yes gene_type:complete